MTPVILLAAEKASFGLVEIVVGLTPSMGGPQRLAEKAGPNRAKELVFTGQLYGAAELREWGVVTRVSGPSRCQKHSSATMETISAPQPHRRGFSSTVNRRPVSMAWSTAASDQRQNTR